MMSYIGTRLLYFISKKVNITFLHHRPPHPSIIHPLHPIRSHPLPFLAFYPAQLLILSLHLILLHQSFALQDTHAHTIDTRNTFPYYRRKMQGDKQPQGYYFVISSVFPGYRYYSDYPQLP